MSESISNNDLLDEELKQYIQVPEKSKYKHIVVSNDINELILKLADYYETNKSALTSALVKKHYAKVFGDDPK